MSKIRPNVSSKGARSGHPERWSRRADVKDEARRARRLEDRRIITEERNH